MWDIKLQIHLYLIDLGKYQTFQSQDEGMVNQVVRALHSVMSDFGKVNNKESLSCQWHSKENLQKKNKISAYALWLDVITLWSSMSVYKPLARSCKYLRWRMAISMISVFSTRPRPFFRYSGGMSRDRSARQLFMRSRRRFSIIRCDIGSCCRINSTVSYTFIIFINCRLSFITMSCCSLILGIPQFNVDSD